MGKVKNCAYFKQGKLKIKFPITPQISFSNGNNNTVVNIVGSRGDINLVGNRKLEDTTLTGVFPKHKNAVVGAAYKNIPTARKCISIISDMLKKDGGKLYFIMTGVTRGWFTIESFEFELKEAGHYSYSISLKQYIKPKLHYSKTKTKKEKNKVNKGKKVTAVSTKRKSKIKSGVTTYVVKSGDTLSSISKKKTGSASNYLSIAKQNKIENPNKLKVGQKLVIKID